MKNKIAFFIAVFFIAACLTPTLSAGSVSPSAFYQTESTIVLDGGVQKNIYQNSLGQTMIQYPNLDAYIDKELAKSTDPNDSMKIARNIISKIEGNSILTDLPNEYLMEAFTYQEATQTVSYIKASSNGTLQYISEDLMLEEIGKRLQQERFLSSSSTNGSFEGNWTSDDGYMKLVTTAVRVESPESSTNSLNHYYIVSASSYWLIEPTYTYEDVLALSFGSAIYDDSYTDFARIYELELCRECNNFYELLYDEMYTAEGYEYNNPEGSEHLNIIYPNGGAGIACRVNFDKDLGICEHYTDMAGVYVDYSYIDTMFSYIRSRVYSQGSDFTISSAYSHKWASIGSIDVSISVGKGSLGGSIGFSGQVMRTDYWGRPIKVDYNSIIE